MRFFGRVFDRCIYVTPFTKDEWSQTDKIFFEDLIKNVKNFEIMNFLVTKESLYNVFHHGETTLIVIDGNKCSGAQKITLFLRLLVFSRPTLIVVCAPRSSQSGITTILLSLKINFED